MVQNLRAYSTLYVVAIKWIVCVQEKIELSSMSHRVMCSSTDISRGLSLATKIIKIAIELPGMAKS